MLPQADYILIPPSGGLERPLASKDIGSLKLISDSERETQFCDLLSEKGVDLSHFWLTEKGVVVPFSAANDISKIGVIASQNPGLFTQDGIVKAPSNIIHASASFNRAVEGSVPSRVPTRNPSIMGRTSTIRYDLAA